VNLDLVTTLRTTGSVRSFTDDIVDDATVHRVLDTARFAPSGANAQGWHVVVVKAPEVRTQLRDLAQFTWNEYAQLTEIGVRPFGSDESGRWPGPPSGVDMADLRSRHIPNQIISTLSDAPAVLVVCVDLRVVAAMDVELDRTQIAGGGSIYPFVWNLLLAARAEGLGGVMTTFLVRQEPQARTILNLPSHVAIAAMVVLGHPVHQNTRLTRKPVEAFTTIDTFDGPALTIEP
jgi:nitroreductase